MGGIATPFAVVNNKAVLANAVVGLAIGGNVEASHVVNNDLRKSREDEVITAALQRLPGSPFPAIHPTVCFILPCVERGDLLCGQENETSILRKTFPNMKVFGFYCFGEIGGKASDKNSDTVIHTYSIVLSTLTLL